MTTVQNALSHWGFQGADTTLVADRENKVYQIDFHGIKFALRHHRSNYRTDAQLLCELQWLDWLSRHNLSVPRPIPSLEGTHLVDVDGVQISVLSWINGTPLAQALPDMTSQERRRVFHKMGIQIAKLHNTSDTWPNATTCDRPHWNADGLVGSHPLWDRFWENPGLSADQKTMLVTFKERARLDLAALETSLDYGLIHADLVSQNVMFDAPHIQLIDFDDGGFGFRIFDVATALYPHRSAADFEAIKTNLISGYRTERSLDVSAIELFTALRAMTYLGWNIARMMEDVDGTRNIRFVDAALRHATAYLAT